MEIGCEDGRWIELAQDRVQWWALILAVTRIPVLVVTFCASRRASGCGRLDPCCRSTSQPSELSHLLASKAGR